MICTDILTNFLNHDPAMFRSFLLNRPRPPQSVLGRLFVVVVNEHVIHTPTQPFAFDTYAWCGTWMVMNIEWF
jgi:hypothetical protein